ncbi:hypothetical protein DVH24_037081 [Malus domestica]|uniref:SPX domain-containing protein n=1 Tax=Malus domestica TaxID=3750 RepID=A0A498HIS9_MALDO|nr:hypothetical protein DVH24_037081 [Malus domestica]
MKFGKEFRTHLEETLPEWRDKFLCYKLLKKLLKGLPATAATIAAVDSLPRHLEFQLAYAYPAAGDGGGGGGFHPLAGLQYWFVAILNEELYKLNDFYMDKEEDFVIRFQELKGRIEIVRERSSRGGVFTSETEFSKEVMDIRKDFVTIHGEMVLLKSYSSLNFTGTAATFHLPYLTCIVQLLASVNFFILYLRYLLLKSAVSYVSTGLVKILKKYDKRTGGVLRLCFTQLAHQPFFTTELLTRLVSECEANLELLFPLEAEVIEGTPTTQDETTPDRSHSNLQSNHSANIASETPSNMEANMDIYRGTVAAMKAIQGLQKPSSTSGPWSLSNHFRSQDEESTGAVTENSTSNSVASWQSDEDDQRIHLEETLPEWRDKFLCYKLLKKLLKRLPATTAAIAAVDSLPRHLEFQPANAHLAVADGSGEFHPLGGLFVPILNEELKKLNDFYVDKEEEFVIRFQELKGRIDRVGERSSSGGVFTSETFRKEVMDIRKDFVTIHGEMVLLKKHGWWNFRGTAAISFHLPYLTCIVQPLVSVNFFILYLRYLLLKSAVSFGSIALVKILKKYDKRTGGELRLCFTQLDHQPLFTTETLTRLNDKCKALNVRLRMPCVRILNYKKMNG